MLPVSTPIVPINIGQFWAAKFSTFWWFKMTSHYIFWFVSKKTLPPKTSQCYTMTIFGNIFGFRWYPKMLILGWDV